MASLFCSSTVIFLWTTMPWLTNFLRIITDFSFSHEMIAIQRHLPKSDTCHFFCSDFPLLFNLHGIWSGAAEENHSNCGHHNHISTLICTKFDKRDHKTIHCDSTTQYNSLRSRPHRDFGCCIGHWIKIARLIWHECRQCDLHKGAYFITFGRKTMEL